VKLKKRNVVYLSPHRDCFTASFVLGDKAVQAARQSGLPKGVIQMLDEAKRYPEGTAVRIDVNEAKDLAIVRKLASVKLEH
jgi:hypothetical protein